MQSELQKDISLLSKVSGIGTSIIAGYGMGGPIGALIAGTIAVVGTGVSVALQDRANQFQIRRQNHDIEQLRELSGLNPLTNGGRI